MKLGRNDACWCGSGKKFKKCHLNRHQQPRLSRQDALKASKKATSERICFHPDASKERCTTVVNAHSVQRRAGGLSAIAEKGHVYGYKADVSQLDRTGGRLEPILIGINEASTFTGFCSYHDSETFAPLERAVFTGSAEQIALLGYRALCKELMAKRNALALNPILREGDRGLPLMVQRAWQSRMDAQSVGFDLALKDLGRAKDNFESAIMSGDFAKLHWLLLRFDAIPTVLASAPLIPEFDFESNLLQNLLDMRSDMEVLAYSLVGTGDGVGIAVFCWIGESPAAERFSSSLESIGGEQLPHRLVQFSFEHFENIYWSPAWWRSLDSRTQKTLIDRINAQVRTVRGPSCLRDDGTRAATWKVVNVSRS